MKERKQKTKKDPKNDNRKRFMITCEVLTDTRKKKFNFGLLYKCQAHEGNFQKRGDIRGNATELNEYKQVRFARAPNNFFFTGKVHFFDVIETTRNAQKTQFVQNFRTSPKLFTFEDFKVLIS